MRAQGVALFFAFAAVQGLHSNVKHIRIHGVGGSLGGSLLPSRYTQLRVSQPRSACVLAASPEDVHSKLDEAGDSWRAVAQQELTSSDLLDYVGWLRQEYASTAQEYQRSSEELLALPQQQQQQQRSSELPSFDFGLAAELAGFAFETYNEPGGSARWEEGADGCRVAFKSDALAKACYRGILTVRLSEADQLPQEDLMEQLASGLQSGFRPFVMLAVVEGDEAKSALPQTGVRGLQRAWDVARSSTAKGKDYVPKGKEGVMGVGKEQYSRATWDPKEEVFFLYVKDPATARLVVSVEEQSALKAGFGTGASSKEAGNVLVVGAASRPLTELLEGCDTPFNDEDGASKKTNGEKKKTSKNLWPSWPLARWPVSWGPDWVPLTIAPEEDKGGKLGSAALAGALMGGPVGALAGAGAILLWNRDVKARVKLGLSYSPLSVAMKQRDAEEQQEGLAVETAAVARKPPKGGTPSLDWGELSGAVGVAERAAELEFIAFVESRVTDTQASLWRDEVNKRMVVAFRGTSDPGDLITDAKILQTPWVKKTEGGKEPKEGEPMVHSGFRDACDSVSRRLKELMVAAMDGSSLKTESSADVEDGGVGEWEVLVTGHSLGGALATLFTQDLARFGIDAGRGLPTEAPSKPWWGRLLDDTSQVGSGLPPRPKRLVCYTYGCPRVGNQAFASLFDTLPLKAGWPRLEIYRVVNGADVVARLPRHGNAIANLLDYEHCGPTVLISEGSADEAARKVPKALPSSKGGVGAVSGGGSMVGGALWVEGETDGQPCPLRDGSPVVDPLADGALLFESLRAGLGKGGAFAAFEKLKKVDPSELTQLVGLDPRFLSAELELMNALRTGAAITHHLEPSYFQAMARAAKAEGFAVEELAAAAAAVVAAAGA